MELDHEQYKMIVESSPNMLWRSGTDTLCNYFNTTWLKFTGRSFEQEVGNGWTEGVHPDDFDVCVNTYIKAFHEQKPFEMEYRLKRKDGQWRWINDRGVPFYNYQNEFCGYIGSCIDVTEKFEGLILKKMAQNDGLTNIYNRQFFEQLAISKFNKLEKNDLNLCIAMIDINSFKKINDTYGHQCGDLILKMFAEILNNNIASYNNNNILGRYGGDEFIILFYDMDYNNSILIMNNIFKEIEERIFHLPENDIKISASFGLCQRTKDENMESLIFRADKKMYEMKRQLKKMNE